ncbi:hypothetical protein GA0074692_2479 [Micromonospora pallida]|uniref:Uncharacterized protein n=1 Tax=Micromonospora pallida TaxID=145854 RepID=A0A1C6SF96_9ACTN|nr:hypothetical protein [Micromonospora pallida]SCL28142.1 hypothetical protein GA0074692_2479 [Micromonospora pallida]
MRRRQPKPDPVPQRLRPRTPAPGRRRWWQGWQLKTAVVAALVPLVIGAVWAQGAKLVRHAWSGPAPSASASPTPATVSSRPDATPLPGGPSSDRGESGGPVTSDGPSDDPIEPTGPAPEPDRTTPPQPPPTTAQVEAQVRRSGTLVMADYTAYDLDSMAADWNPTRDDWGPDRDAGYASWRDDANNNVLVSREDPKYAAALSGDGPWRRTDCVRARYGDPSARPVGDRLLEGRGVCVVTSAGRYALLVVTRSVEKQLTVRVTVWE